MNDHPLDDATPDRESVAQGRRRLLKAAATTAPLIATLPNGAAWASASTAQCIATSKTANPSTVASQADAFVRQAGFQYTITPGNITVYSIGATEGSPYYLANGTVRDLQTGETISSPGTSVALLRYFKPNTDSTDVADCATTPVPNCVYPRIQVAAPSADNQPLYGTCLCSVNPTLVAGACPWPGP